MKLHLNVETVAIDESLSLTLSAADLQEALEAHLRDALHVQGLPSCADIAYTRVDAPSLKSTADLSSAIATSLFSPRVGGAEPR